MALTATNKEKLWDLIKDLKVGMLVSRDSNSLRARPMQILQDKFEDKLYFLSEKDGPKVEEIIEEPHICVTFGCPEENTYVSVSGLATVTHREDKIKEFWNPAVSAWFPEGKESATLIEIDCQRAEYWDSTTNKMEILFEIFKANITNKKPNLGDNEKLS